MKCRLWLRSLTMPASAAALYAGLLCYPDPLFAYHVREGAVALHSPRPLPARAHAIARDADARVARSPLYDATAQYDVYLCDTPWRFALFSAHRYRAGGVAYGALTTNVFLRPSSIERDRLIRFDGSELPEERTLTYFIAHEVVHAMLTKSLGRIAYQRLATWQNEGYADYIAKAGAFDGVSEHPDPDLRYHLRVRYWLDQRRLSVTQMLALPDRATAGQDGR